MRPIKCLLIVSTFSVATQSFARGVINCQIVNWPNGPTIRAVIEGDSRIGHALSQLSFINSGGNTDDNISYSELTDAHLESSSPGEAITLAGITGSRAGILTIQLDKSTIERHPFKGVFTRTAPNSIGVQLVTCAGTY